MYVIKRSGVREEVSFDKVKSRIKNLSKDLNVDPIIIAQKVCSRIYAGVKTYELDELAASLCTNMVTQNLDYGILGNRIIISNHQKSSSPSFSETIYILFNNKDKKGNPNPLVSKELYEIVMKNKDKLNSVIDYNRDFEFDYFGFKTLERSYLLKVNGKTIERPSHLFMRVSLGLHDYDLKSAIESYDYLSQKYFTHATPTLFNAGTVRPQLLSCFLLNTEDSIDGIYGTITDCARISKWAGGLGVCVTPIRSNNAQIRGSNGKSSGIIPMLRVYNETGRYVNQSGKRNGSIAMYLEPWHGDILEFLDIRKNQGAEEERCRDLFTALWIPDLFMKKLSESIEKNIEVDWYLFNPDMCPELYKTFGDEFEYYYNKFVEEKKYDKKIDVLKLWKKVLSSQIETGTPYILFKDHINKKNNQSNLGTITNSNLCVDGKTEILTREGYRVIENMVNQDVDIWNGYEFSNVKIMKTGENQTMNKIIFSNGEELICTPYHKFYIQKGFSRGKIMEVRCNDLQIDQKIIKFSYPFIDFENDNFIYPYTHGLFCADGTYFKQNDELKQCNYKKIDGTDYCKRHQFFKNCNKYNEFINDYSKCNGIINVERPKISLYGEKKKLLQFLDIRNDIDICENEKKDRIDVMLPLCLEEKYKVPIEYTKDIRLKWLEGLVDGDGCITNNGNTQTIQISSINIEFLKQCKKLLHTLGCDAKISLMHKKNFRYLPDHNGSNKLYECQDTYRIIINTNNLNKLRNLGFSPKRLIINEHICNREASEFIKIKNIEKNYKIADTYCFTEPLRNKGVFNNILTGNCAEITEYNDTNEYACCCLSSISLPKFVEKTELEGSIIIYSKTGCPYCEKAKRELPYFQEINLDDEELRFSFYKKWSEEYGEEIRTVPQIFINNKRIGGYDDFKQYTKPKFNFDKLEKVCHVMVRNLNKVIDKNFYPVPQTKLSNFKHRPLGVGVQGLADTFFKMRMSFESEEARELNREIFEHIQFACYEASMILSKEREEYLIKNKIEIIENGDYVKTINMDGFIFTEAELSLKEYRGSYISFMGSPLQKGNFSFDLWNDEPKYVKREKWNELMKNIQLYGIRNSLLTALMPTASTSQILGNTECFEQITSNIYTRSTLAGDFVCVNQYLMKDLEELGLWNVEMKDMIIANNGSIQKIDIIPDEIKDLYKTVWEIKQKSIIDLAADRGPYICQTQSMNLFFEEPTQSTLTSALLYGWKRGLKTGSYYIRTRPKIQAQQFTIDPSVIRKIQRKNHEESICESCSG